MRSKFPRPWTPADDIRLPSNDDSDLWGFNPQTRDLYTTGERRDLLSQRGRGGFKNTLPNTEWDKWFDAQHTNRVAQTMGVNPLGPDFENELSNVGAMPGVNEKLLGELGQQRVNMSVGSSPAGSSQLRGYSVQPGGSLEGLRQASKPRQPYQPLTAAEQAISQRPARKY